MKGGKGGFGSELPGSFGRLLMRDQYNSELYGPLQHLYTQGKAAGTDVWIHKNRCYHSSLARHLVLITSQQDERLVGTPDSARPLPAGKWHYDSAICGCERRSGLCLNRARAPAAGMKTG